MNIRGKFIICFIAIIIIPINGISQKKLILSVESGLSFSQFPSKNTVVTWQINDSTVTKTNPVIGPVIGVSAKLPLTKSIQIMFGLNYQLSGTKTYSYSQGIDPFISPVSFFKNWQNLKIHKVCVPIALGFEFNLMKIKPMVFLGIKPNLLLSAELYEKSFHSQWTESIETTTNLFTKKTDYQPPKRIINQLCFGISTSIGEHFKFNLSYNYGNNYYITTYWQSGNHSRVAYPVKTSIKSSDCIIGIQYVFIKSEKTKGSQ